MKSKQKFLALALGVGALSMGSLAKNANACYTDSNNIMHGGDCAAIEATAPSSPSMTVTDNRLPVLYTDKYTGYQCTGNQCLNLNNVPVLSGTVFGGAGSPAARLTSAFLGGAAVSSTNAALTTTLLNLATQIAIDPKYVNAAINILNWIPFY